MGRFSDDFSAKREGGPAVGASFGSICSFVCPPAIVGSPAASITSNWHNNAQERDGVGFGGTLRAKYAGAYFIAELKNDLVFGQSLQWITGKAWVLGNRNLRAIVFDAHCLSGVA